MGRRQPLRLDLTKYHYFFGVISFLVAYFIGFSSREIVKISCVAEFGMSILGDPKQHIRRSESSKELPLLCDEAIKTKFVGKICETHEMEPMNTYLTVRDYSTGKNIISEVFNTIHHPELAVHNEMYLSQIPNMSPDDPLSSCKSIYMTRTGSKTEMSVKCLAVIQMPALDVGDAVFSHRYGTSAKLVNQYQQDYALKENFEEERELLPLMLKNRVSVIDRFKLMLGEPYDPVTNTRKTAILMVRITIDWTDNNTAH
jgi:hypothetical protein